MNDMTEIKTANLKWLDAEKRCNALMQENADLRSQVFELKMKIIPLEFRAISAECMLTPLMQIAMVGKP